MAKPTLSAHFERRQPSSVRLAQIEFAQRNDDTLAVNTAIGNVTLPMHPAMQRRMLELGASASPFGDGVVQYCATVGMPEAQRAFLNIIASSGADTSKLHCQITEGGSQAMELVLLGICGEAGSSERPVLVIDPAYANYRTMAERVGRRVVAVRRRLQDDGRFTLPNLQEIERTIQQERPGALVVIPYDNPTGQLCTPQTLKALARLCVEHGMWLVSDEAYRELHYQASEPTSIWRITDNEVPHIEGQRISIESASKVWNACGLRIGALVTDNRVFHEKAVAENTANLCANVIGQHIFGALAQEDPQELAAWYQAQRDYYRGMLSSFSAQLHGLLPGVIVSRPDAAIYSVVDVRRVVEPGFDAVDFVRFCAREGRVAIDQRAYTLLVAPMDGFYGKPNTPRDGDEHAQERDDDAATQMRIAYVEAPEVMRLVPHLFVELLRAYEKRRSAPSPRGRAA